MKYDITHALQELRPGAQWILKGLDYSGLEWMNGDKPPSREELEAKVAEMDSREPLRLLRIERNKRLAASDWVVTRSISTGVPLSKEWKAYLDALRALPDNANPKIGDDGRLDLSSVDWPVLPE